MSFIKQTKEWFFRSNAPINPNVEGDLKDHLVDRGAPSQGGVWEQLVASVPFFKNPNDRAKISTGGAVENEVGITAVNPDADVLTYTDGLRVDRTLVPTAKNLTEVFTSALNDNIPSINGSTEYDDTAIEIGKDVVETRRNKYFPRLRASFTAWIATEILPRLVIVGGTAGQVLTKIDGTDFNAQWETPDIGEDNDGINVGGGTGNVFRDKIGEDLNFKTINAADPYTTVTDNVDTIGIGVDEGTLLTYMQANLSFPGVPLQTANNFGGGSNVYKQTLGTELEFRTIIQGDGINVAQNADDVTITVDDAYINGLIAAADTGGGGVIGVPYLFHSTSTSDQSSLPVLTKVRFLDDANSGNFDNGNTWSTSQWTANADAIGENIEFSTEFTIELVVNTPPVSDVTFTLVKEDALMVKTTLDDVTISYTGLASGTTITSSLNNNATGAIVAGDKVYLEVTSYGGAGNAGDIKVNLGGTIYNVTA